jgi:hypothetical protein
MLRGIASRFFQKNLPTPLTEGLRLAVDQWLMIIGGNFFKNLDKDPYPLHTGLKMERRGK